MRRLKIIALLAFITSFLILCSPSALASEAGSAGTLKDTSTIKGKITTQPACREEGLALGTEQGFYLVSNGRIKNYIESPPVKDFVFLGESRVVIATEERSFPNIKCYDLSNGELIWSRAYSTEIYSMDYGRVERQVQPYDVESLGDLNSDGVNELAVSIGHKIVSIDGRTGETLWKVDHNYPFWKLTKLNNTLFAGSQDGYLYSVDISTGDINYKEELAESFNHPHTGEIPRSIWSITPVQSPNSVFLAISTEDGRVYRINPEDGEIAWESKILEYNREMLKNYYQSGRNPRSPPPTMPGDMNFFNVEIETVKDSTGDQTEDLIITVGNNSDANGRRYQGVTEGLYLLDGETGRTQWQNKSVEMGGVGGSTCVSDSGSNYLLIPSSQDRKRSISVLDLSQGSVENTIQIQPIPTESGGGEADSISYLNSSGGDLFFSSDYKDLIVTDLEGEVNWSVPCVRDLETIGGDFLKGGPQDVLAYSRNLMGREKTISSRAIFVKNGRDGSTTWSRVLDRNSFLENGGFSGITKVNNVLGENETNLLAYRQVGRSKQEQWKESMEAGRGGEEIGVPPPKLLLLSGDTGEVLREITLVNDDKEHFRAPENWYFWISSMDIVGDLNGNGSKDVIVGSHGRIFVKDMKTGDLIWERKYGKSQGPELFHLPPKKKIAEALDGGEIPDSLRDKLEGSGFEISSSGSVSRIDRGWKIDFEGETFIVERGEDALRVLIQTEKIWDWVRDWRSKYHAVNDINGDGIEELITTSESQRLVLLKSDTKNGLSFSRKNVFDTDANIPNDRIATVDDINGDGINEITFEIHREGQPPQFNVLCPSSGEIIMRTNKRKRRTKIDLDAGDFNGDGDTESLVFQLETEAGPQLSVLDGGETIRKYRFRAGKQVVKFGYSSAMPAASAGDLDGDGSEEIAVVKSGEWRSGAKVDVYDLQNDNLVKTIILEEFADEGNQNKYIPGVLTKRISDVTGDGYKELGVVALVGQGEEKHVSFFAVDVREGSVLASYSSRVFDILGLETGVGLLKAGGNIDPIEIGDGVELKSPIERSPLKISWDSKDNCVTQVLADENPVALTTEKSAQLRLPPGDHEITVKSTNPEGVTTYDSMEVDVGGSGSLSYVLYVGFVIMILVLFMPTILKEIRG